MSDTEINIAIAEITGEEHGLVCHSHGLVSYDRAIPHEWQGVQVFKCPWCKSDLQQISPGYTGDLNAMHEAEKVLGHEHWQVYSDLLRSRMADDCADDGSSPLWMHFPFWHATARQRAEAFLRTFNKWKD